MRPEHKEMITYLDSRLEQLESSRMEYSKLHDDSTDEKMKTAYNSIATMLFENMNEVKKLKVKYIEVHGVKL